VTSPPAPSWYARLVADLDAADTRAAALTRGLTVAQLNWKPGPQAWSIGQCLEHLCISNEVYVVPMAVALDTTPRGAVDDITPGRFGRAFIRRYIEPAEQKKPARAPRKIVPVSSQLVLTIVDRFRKSNEGIRRVIEQARPHDINHVRFRNPFVPVIRFSVGTGLLILTRHNHRHLGQAERVTRSRGFPPE
jgi:hypothetical protein